MKFEKHKVKFLIKNFVAHILYYSGSIHLLKRMKLKDKIVVLMYHRVIPESQQSLTFSHKSIIVSPETFANHLKWLKESFPVLSINQFYSVYNDSKSPDLRRGACLITFDDGWIDNYEFAYPELRREQCPATIFLPVDYIGKKVSFWQETLTRALYVLPEIKTAESESLIRNLGLQGISITNGEDRKANILEYVSRLKAAKNDEIDRIIDRTKQMVGEKFKRQNHIDRYLNWDQVSEMSENGISFGSHAKTHRILTNLDFKVAENELSESYKTIKGKLNPSPMVIAYPNGDSNDSIQNAAIDTGFKLGFGTKSGLFESGSNHMDIKRINIHEQKALSKPLLLTTILGIF